MSWLIDTSVLIGTIHDGNPRQALAIDALASLVNIDRMFIVPQNIVEFWAVVTRPASSNGFDLPTEKADKEVERIKSQFALKPDDETIYDNWEKLVKDYKVSGKATHDARLVAAMQSHGIESILTFNTDDFNRYADIINVSGPQDIVDQIEKSGLPE